MPQLAALALQHVQLNHSMQAAQQEQHCKQPHVVQLLVLFPRYRMHSCLHAVTHLAQVQCSHHNHLTVAAGAASCK